MVSKKKSRKSTQQSKGRTAAHSEENGNAIQNIDSLLKSLEERNAAQTANHAPPGGENTELTRDSNENDLDMQWADLLQVDTGFKSSEIQRKGKTKSKKPQKSKSSSIEIEGDTQQAGKENDIEMQWADLLHTGTGVQHKGQSSGRSKMKKKPKRDTRTRTTQVPKQIELRGPEAAQKARRRTSGQNKVSIQEPAATIDDLLAEPSGTPSDDADDNAFLKKVKSLAVEKKKVSYSSATFSPISLQVLTSHIFTRLRWTLKLLGSGPRGSYCTSKQTYTGRDAKLCRPNRGAK